MKTNKIMFVGAAFLMMISCDNNSNSFDNGKGEVTDLTHIQTEMKNALSIRSITVSYSSLIDDICAIYF